MTIIDALTAMLDPRITDMEIVEILVSPLDLSRGRKKNFCVT